MGKGPRERDFLCVDCLGLVVATSLVVAVRMDGSRYVLVFLRGWVVGLGGCLNMGNVVGKVGDSTLLKRFARSEMVLV